MEWNLNTIIGVIALVVFILVAALMLRGKPDNNVPQIDPKVPSKPDDTRPPGMQP